MWGPLRLLLELGPSQIDSFCMDKMQTPWYSFLLVLKQPRRNRIQYAMNCKIEEWSHIIQKWQILLKVAHENRVKLKTEGVGGGGGGGGVKQRVLLKRVDDKNQENSTALPCLTLYKSVHSSTASVSICQTYWPTAAGHVLLNFISHFPSLLFSLHHIPWET